MQSALTETEWSIIQPILLNKPRGIPGVDGRRVLNGIFWGLRSALAKTTTVALQPTSSKA